MISIDIYSFTVVSQINGNPGVPRRIASFPPSIWQDRFLKYDQRDIMMTREVKLKVEELKQVVKREVFTNIRGDDGSSRQLKLIDSVQRLGLSYHFEKDMEDVLGQMFDKYQDQFDKERDLHDVSLRFRLLRQHGFYVSSAIFENFKDKKSGNFEDYFVEDVPGMLALYEASHMMVRGEEILEEALAFTTTHLVESKSSSKTSPLLSAQINSALKRPIRKSLERLHARQYISFYEQEASHDKPLLELAKLDFNLLQDLHNKEVADISRWWKKAGLEKKLPFIRDRVVEIFIQILGVYFQPQHLLARNILAKATILALILDDTYDSYGTFEELELFTEAIQRWDINCMDQLPEYMQFIYQTLLKTYQEFEDEIANEEKYRVHYSKEAMKIFAKAFLDEARWLDQRYVPMFEEYLSVGLVSGGISMFTTTSLIGMRDFVTKDIYEWLFSDPKILRASYTILRLMNDIASHKFEQKRGHVASAVECYRKQYKVSEEEAYNELNKKVENAWKDINQEILARPKHVPMHVLARFDNMARVVDLLYRDGDGFTAGGKEINETVSTLFLDPVP